MEQNPFTDDYVVRELNWYEDAIPKAALKIEPLKIGNLSLKYAEPNGRLDDYLSVNYRMGMPLTPMLQADGTFWMSLTPMELQSAWPSIELAHGYVATAGLGLGYAALKMAEKEKVQRVDVYEKDADVIEAFKRLNVMHGAAIKKINIIHGDVRELMKGKQYDYVFMDPYANMLPDEIIDDIYLFNMENNIVEYRPWGFEWVLRTLYNSGLILYDELQPIDQNFFDMFEETQNLRERTMPDLQYAVDVLEAMREAKWYK